MMVGMEASIEIGSPVAIPFTEKSFYRCCQNPGGSDMLFPGQKSRRFSVQRRVSAPGHKSPCQDHHPSYGAHDAAM